jgi:ribonuclease P protein component
VRSFNTLKNRRDFLNASCFFFKSKHILLKCNTKVDDLGFGFTASKRVGNAVKRNRAKRRLREIAHEIVKSKNLTKNHWVLIAKPSCVDAPYDTLKNDVNFAISKALQAIQSSHNNDA